jgi:hypothetical protein
LESQRIYFLLAPQKSIDERETNGMRGFCMKKDFKIIAAHRGGGGSERGESLQSFTMCLRAFQSLCVSFSKR